MLVADLKPRILIVDDDPDVLTAARLLLRRTAETVETERRAEAALTRLEAGTWDAILLNMNPTDGKRDGANGYNWLERFRSVDPSVSVVLMTAFGGVPVAVEAMKRGATDFVSKPWAEREAGRHRARRGHPAHHARRDGDRAPGRPRTGRRAVARTADAPILGNSPSDARVIGLVERAASTDANVLVLGENGTGKEMIARELHRRSGRAGRVLLSVDLGAVAEGVVESELFGHRRGAFSDARDDRVGPPAGRARRHAVPRRDRQSAAATCSPSC